MPKFVCIDDELVLNLEHVVAVEKLHAGDLPHQCEFEVRVRMAATKLTKSGGEGLQYSWSGNKARAVWRLFKQYGIVEEFDWQLPAGGWTWK